MKTMKLQFDEILLCLVCVMDGVMAGISTTEKTWPLGIIWILAGLFAMYCMIQHVYHKGAMHACDTAIDLLKKAKEELGKCPKLKYKAVFHTYWIKNDFGADVAFRNGYYNAACKLAGIEQHWDKDEKPDVAEKDDVYDLYPHKDNPVKCVLDSRTVEAESLEQLFDLRDKLCEKGSGVIHCCLDLQPMKEVENE